MKNTYRISALLSLFFLLTSVDGFAQTLGFNYQAIVKSDQTQTIEVYGETIEVKVLASSDVSMRFTIIDASGTVDTLEYQEVHDTRTNSLGEINLTIGSGTATIGDFTDIEWDGKKKVMEVEVDYTATRNNFHFSNRQDLLYLPHPSNIPIFSGINDTIRTMNLAIDTLSSRLQQNYQELTEADD